MTTTFEPELLLMIDVETTGLDPEHHCLLEVAGFLVDKGTLERVEGTEFEFVVYPTAPYPRHRAHPHVRQMHDTSGLWDELPYGTPINEVHRAVWNILYQYRGHTIYPCGNSVHFDVSFLKKHLPGVADLLHYRVVDVTSLALMSDKPRYPKRALHRAFDDIEETYQELLYLVRD